MEQDTFLESSKPEEDSKANELGAGNNNASRLWVESIGDSLGGEDGVSVSGQVHLVNKGVGVPSTGELQTEPASRRTVALVVYMGKGWATHGSNREGKKEEH